MEQSGSKQIKNAKFTSKQIEENLHLKVNTLHYYIESGAIIPDVDKGRGTGTKRIFSSLNFFEACIIKHLMNYRQPKKSIVAMMKSIRDAGDRHFLNPARFLKSDSDKGYIEFLVFISDGEGSFTHRFIKHGGGAYVKPRQHWREQQGKTFYDGLEDIGDFLTTMPNGIFINLTITFGLFILNFLVQEY